MARTNIHAGQDVDSTLFGNKTRFINNSSQQAANCRPKNLLCNTVHRIGLYALQDMPAGTELFFHYGYADAQTKGFKEPGGKKSAKVVAVRTTSGTAAASSSSSKPRTYQSDLSKLSKPERRKRQTENARAALYARKSGQTTEPDSAGTLKRARKSVQSSSFTRPARGTHRDNIDPEGT